MLDTFETLEEARERIFKSRESEFVCLTEKIESLSRETDYAHKESRD